jgi:hypothetical protein
LLLRLILDLRFLLGAPLPLPAGYRAHRRALAGIIADRTDRAADNPTACRASQTFVSGFLLRRLRDLCLGDCRRIHAVVFCDHC